MSKVGKNETDVKRTCATCEFNFGNVCVGYGIQKDTQKRDVQYVDRGKRKMFPTGCDDYGICLEDIKDQKSE